MRNGICPKCHSTEILAGLTLQDYSQYSDPYVEIVEPDPPKRPFIWSPQVIKSEFEVYICGACGYSEIYAKNYRELNEGRRRGFTETSK
jgi:predicted nucleic-acid-binding Zn-ribbon protein